jgi:hypothetical protein
MKKLCMAWIVFHECPVEKLSMGCSTLGHLSIRIVAKSEIRSTETDASA